MLYLAVLANEFFPKFTSKIIIVCPLIGVVLTTLLCASPVSWLSSRRWSSSKVLSSSILLHYKLSYAVLALNWNLTCINSSDWASFWCIKSSRSTINIASCFPTCCCIYSRLLDFKNIIWRIHITHYFYRVWDAGKTCSSYLIVLLNYLSGLGAFLPFEKCMNHSTFPDVYCLCLICINSSRIDVLA